MSIKCNCLERTKPKSNPNDVSPSLNSSCVTCEASNRLPTTGAATSIKYCATLKAVVASSSLKVYSTPLIECVIVPLVALASANKSCGVVIIISLY